MATPIEVTGFGYRVSPQRCSDFPILVSSYVIAGRGCFPCSGQQKHSLTLRAVISCPALTAVVPNSRTAAAGVSPVRSIPVWD